MNIINLLGFVLKGGIGSGNFGHQGIPGQVGGSRKGSIQSLISASKDFRERLTSQERNAIDSYTGVKYNDINGELRESSGRLGYIKSKEIRNLIRTLDSAMEKSPALTEDLTVYRGVEDFSDTGLDNLRAGDEFIDYGYMSTSPDLNVAKKFTGGETGRLLKFNIPKGTRGIAPIDGDHEVLITRSRSDHPYNLKWKISKVTKDLIEFNLNSPLS